MKILPSFLVTAFLVGTATLASAKPVRDADKADLTPAERIAARFDRIDTDNDGSISRAEFRAHHKARMDKMKERKADKAKQKNGQKQKKNKKARNAKRAAKAPGKSV